MDHRIDKARYRSSMARLQEIFRGITDTVTDVSTWRCPYKNVDNRCTATFSCRNQDRNVPESDLFICTGDDQLDYRNAWDV